MQTIAFKVKPDTNLYKNYFAQKKEKAFSASWHGHFWKNMFQSLRCMDSLTD